ncbi:EF-hand domain pair [Streptoalloteichus tenebrarius]|uniref:EF-hand domain pair n=1 Tax=Streptoalloteichus tenebrarius (strain ATCC 17920 / DSM 40477 / JCM 4838 / CBS 697.72 / NBRC 16177 / NCIMB 11028 / NRRL B-12390 / A12253. 1 / ISP 5477) TaxID=1933 RepID=A0ABT1HMC1_STRSD|nr:EF-hand domain-containing protein [Streptoalloteichus tenebrarius]MCP2256667.1 EF-hand domain pair [Streptoalloteichus tenebrarius]
MATTTTDPITAKLEALFHATDSNNDGHVEWEDYHGIIERCLSAYKIDKNDRRARALLAAYQMSWIELLRHANGEDRLSKDQFVLATRLSAVDTSRHNLVEGLSHAIFDIIDSDGTNAIDKAEFEKYVKVWGIDASSALEAFGKLDLDGDGEISRHEFIRAAREFFYSPDLDTPGSLFFGHLSV